MARNVVMEYDDTRLQRLFAELEPKRRAQALRGAFRKEANVLRRAAVTSLRSKMRSDADLEKGVRALVFKRQLGFRVTVGTVNRKSRRTGDIQTKGYHTNRFGLEKPVLIWAEDGTAYRRAKRRGNAGRGRMPRYGFIVDARNQVGPTVTQDLQNHLREYTVRTAKKYGCNV